MTHSYVQKSLLAFLLLIPCLGTPSLSANFNRNQNYDFWVRQLQNPSVDMKIIAMKRLAMIRRLDAARFISPYLRSEMNEVRFEAARALGQIPSQESLNALGQRASEEKDVYIKAEINRSIRSLRDYFEKLQPPAEDSTEQ